MKYAVEMASGGMINVSSFTNIYTGVQAILRFCLSNFRCCNVGITDGWIFMKCAVQMWSGAMIYAQVFIKIGSDVQKLLAGDTHTDIQTHRESR
jgi:hypothetical protein